MINLNNMSIQKKFVLLALLPTATAFSAILLTVWGEMQGGSIGLLNKQVQAYQAHAAITGLAECLKDERESGIKVSADDDGDVSLIRLDLLIQ